MRQTVKIGRPGNLCAESVVAGGKVFYFPVDGLVKMLCRYSGAPVGADIGVSAIDGDCRTISAGAFQTLPTRIESGYNFVGGGGVEMLRADLVRKIAERGYQIPAVGVFVFGANCVEFGCGIFAVFRFVGGIGAGLGYPVDLIAQRSAVAKRQKGVAKPAKRVFGIVARFGAFVQKFGRIFNFTFHR